MRIGILPVILCCCVFVSLFGCANLSDSRKDKEISGMSMLEPQEITKFSDIPVPMGFRELNEDSYSFENAGVRVAVLRYQGKADINRVISFYKEQMPIYGWNLLNIIEYSESVLNFDRDNETCIITLTPKGASVLMTISLGPKSQVYKKSKKSLDK